MFPFFTPDQPVQVLVNAIIALVRALLDVNGVEQPVIDAIIGLREFAGAFFQDASGYATALARVVDDLLDVALRLLGLDPLGVRGDH